MLEKLTAFLSEESPEIQLNTLRVLLAYLQKFEGNAEFPIKEVKDLLVVEKLHQILENENEMAGELARLSLSILTQISYSFPQEVAKHNAKRIVSLCDGTSSTDLRTQEAAVRLICNLLTEEVSRDLVIKSDGLFGIFHCLINNNKAALKYALACLLNLTFLTNAKSSNIIQQITHNGGLAHLIGALQKSAALGDHQAMIYAIKALSNLAASSPNINLVIAELGSFDLLLQILLSQCQLAIQSDLLPDQKISITQLSIHCLICIQSISSINFNKSELIDKSSFLKGCSQLFGTHPIDPNLLKGLL